MFLELVYTKIATQVEGGMWQFWGEDLEVELISRFLSAEACEENGHAEWKCQFIEFTEEELSDTAIMREWQPLPADKEEAGGLLLLTQSPDGVDISELVEVIGDHASALIERLMKHGLIAQSGSTIELTAKQAALGFLPDGRIYFDENNTGRLYRWAMTQMDRFREGKAALEKTAESSSNETES